MQESGQKKGFWYKVVEKQLKYRYWIIGIMALLTIFFIYHLFFNLQVRTNFEDLYPPDHQYIKLYNEYKDMFGSANMLKIILKRTDGEDIYQTETLAKLDKLTQGVLNIKGVNPLQVSSAVHPSVKQIKVSPYGVGIYSLTHPSVGAPDTQKACDTFQQTVYRNEGVRGFYIGLEDKSAVVYAGLWEEGLDFEYLYTKVNQLQASVEDGNHATYATGYPMLYAWLSHYTTTILLVLTVTIGALILLLAVYFRSSRGVVIPLFSGIFSAIWGLGFAGVTGLNLDPLLLVVPILLSARALSHSCQCMDRYHQEYAVDGDKNRSIVNAYAEVFSPCTAGAITDGLGVLTIAIASIPLMQKLAFIASFWVISILVAVTLLNPIILYFLPAPKVSDRAQLKDGHGKRSRPSIWLRCYEAIMTLTVRLSGPRLKWVMVVIILLLALPGVYTITHLKIGDSSAGGAILYADHPYNVAAKKMNENYLGQSRLTVLIEGKEEGAIKNQSSLRTMEKLGFFMENNIPNVGGTLSLADLIQRINRSYHDGSPKWEVVPEGRKSLSSTLFVLSSSMSPSEMNRYVSKDYTDSNVKAYFRNYNNRTIESAISQTEKFAEKVNTDPESKIEIELASGILGILAAVNQEVGWSYWAIFIVIFSTIFLICLILYRSLKAALILIIPVFVAQVLCDLFMMLYGIDLNINSLPVASVGVGVGIDYGIYLMSRLKEECARTNDFEKAKMVALSTTGKTIMFVASALSISMIPWLFSPIKFQAQMGLLILFLMVVNMIGALIFLPTLTAVLKPSFVKRMNKAQSAE